jgi:hypothetical protein
VIIGTVLAVEVAMWPTVTLSPSSLRIYFVPFRTVPWHPISHITVRRRRGFRIIEVHTDRRRIRLPYPTTRCWFTTRRGRARFDRQYAQIVQWWTDHRDEKPLTPGVA